MAQVLVQGDCESRPLAKFFQVVVASSYFAVTLRTDVCSCVAQENICRAHGVVTIKNQHVRSSSPVFPDPFFLKSFREELFPLKN